MTPIISHVSLDKDFFPCLVLHVLKAGFPAHTHLVAWVQAVFVGDVKDYKETIMSKACHIIIIIIIIIIITIKASSQSAQFHCC